MKGCKWSWRHKIQRSIVFKDFEKISFFSQCFLVLLAAGFLVVDLACVIRQGSSELWLQHVKPCSLSTMVTCYRSKTNNTNNLLFKVFHLWQSSLLEVEGKIFTLEQLLTKQLSECVKCQSCWWFPALAVCVEKLYTLMGVAVEVLLPSVWYH